MLSKIFFVVTLFFLILVPFIGVEVRGSTRWLDLPFVPRFQPIELLKPFFIIMITFYVAGAVKGFLGIGLPAAAMALLTLFINPLDAIALIIVPIIFTNVGTNINIKQTT